MKKTVSKENLRGLLLTAVVFGLMAAMFALPIQFAAHAGNGQIKDNTVNGRTVSHDPNIENYDIRTDKTAAEQLAGFRANAGKNSAVIQNKRAEFIAGEQLLRQRVPTLKVEYNDDIRIPEVITPAVGAGRNFLTGTTSGKRSEVLRDFLKQNQSLVGMNDGQLNDLKVTADYTNPDGNLSYARLEQTMNGIPVFRGEVNAGFTKNGEMFRIVNNLAPDMEYNALSSDFGDPAEAVRFAAKYINHDLKAEESTQNQAASNNLKAVFGEGDWATTAEKMYFPTEPGVARTAWRVLIWQPVNAYYVIVDAETGAMLWRKNLTEDQTQAATYNVYTNTTSPLKAMTSPAPFAPAPLDPTANLQSPLGARTNITLIGNEAPYTFNNNGWITDGTNGTNGTTDGNAVEAGLDIDGVNGVDAAGKADGTSRVFNFAYNPGPGNPGPGDSPTLPAFRNGAVTQLFYYNNRYHDELYLLGFTEQARNYQASNFGRGGLENDRVSGEAQDSSGTNNANFSIAADGTRGRMQMYVFTGPSPQRDGDLDGDVVIHEHTHGLSQRLIGNGSGLSTNRSGSMGEGWSDFYGLSLLSNPAENPQTQIATTGGWVTNNLTSGYSNYYYGIRRFPYAVKTLTGGPNNRPHNPQTFADIDAAQINNSDGAFPRNPAFANTATEVHNAGEIWCVALWEVRARMITRLGWAVGNRKALQLVTDGMKLTALNPNFLQARDGILAAAQASSFAPEAAADVADVWAGFAARGMGFSAIDNNSSVVESFDLPNVVQTPTFSFTDAGGNNNGFPEPGEPLVLTIPLSNSTGNTATGVTLQVVGGGTANYGDIASGTTVTRTVNYTVPSVACGSTLTLTFNISGSLGASIVTRNITVGTPLFSGTTQNFDGVTAPALPQGYTSTQTGANTGWVTSTALPSSAPNAVFSPDPATAGSANLETSARITSATSQLGFKINYNTESTWDGTALEVKIGNGAWQDITAAGGSFVSGGYNIGINTASGTVLAGRQAWSGTSGGYIDSVANLPASANGQVVGLRFVTASDTSVGGVGTYIDNIQLTGGSLFSTYICVPVSPTVRSRADFDGDGKTDTSVFRNGTFHLNRSTAGYTAVQWGAASDTSIGGDFDGDNKADLAVWRAGAPGTAAFYVLNSLTNTVRVEAFGQTGDIPVVGDFDGDGKADLATYRAGSPSTFFYRGSLGNPSGNVTYLPFGTTGDTPLVGDFDGDGKADIAVFRNGVWYMRQSTAGIKIVQWGLSTDKLVPADYDGDGKDDIAVFRNGTWFVLRSSDSAAFVTQWGSAGDLAVPGDYDGDGKSDVAIFRNGVWYANRTTAGVQITSFGLAGDIPMPSRYIP